MRRSLPVSLALLFSLIALPALAATLQGGENLKITAPIKDDAYLAGGQVSVDQPIEGDLLAAGGTVLIKTVVQEDIAAVGGTLFLEGTTKGDVRIAGGNVFVRNTIEGDLIVLGGSVVLSPDATVKGDVIAAGGDLTIAGSIGGKLLARGGNVTMNGMVKGTADIRAENVSIGGSIDGDAMIVGTQKITFEPSAKLMRDVRYWQPKLEIQPTKTNVKGLLTYDPALAPKEFPMGEKEAKAGFLAALAGISVIMVLSAALTILLLLLISKSFFPDAARTLIKQPWTSMLYGFLFFVATPIAGLLFLITVIGAPIGLVIFMAYLCTLIFAKTLTAVVLAQVIVLRYKLSWGKPSIFFLALALYLAMKIIGFIPVLGWIVCLAAILFAFGALMTVKWAKFAKVR